MQYSLFFPFLDLKLKHEKTDSPLKSMNEGSVTALNIERRWARERKRRSYIYTSVMQGIFGASLTSQCIEHQVFQF